MHKIQEIRDSALATDRIPRFRIRIRKVRWCMHPEAENFRRLLIKVGDFRFQISAYHTELFGTQVTSLEVGIASQISVRAHFCAVGPSIRPSSCSSATFMQGSNVCLPFGRSFLNWNEYQKSKYFQPFGYTSYRVVMRMISTYGISSQKMATTAERHTHLVTHC